MPPLPRRHVLLDSHRGLEVPPARVWSAPHYGVGAVNSNSKYGGINFDVELEFTAIGTSVRIRHRLSPRSYYYEWSLSEGILGTPADALLVVDYEKAHPGSFKEAMFLFDDPTEAVMYIWRLVKELPRGSFGEICRPRTGPNG